MKRAKESAIVKSQETNTRDVKILKDFQKREMEREMKRKSLNYHT